jgi:ubiquinone/menaquinone biosynthesis C-methylase UbiE
MASFYDRVILPKLLQCGCSSGPVMKQRAKLVPKAQGRVLELGVGMGLNLAFYDPDRVKSLTGVDPSPELREIALAAPHDPRLAVDVLDGAAESLPFRGASFDCVVCTFTLCSVQDPAAALGEARRVLKPGGRLLFCEHGLSPDPALARWQRRWEPLWTRMTGGCRLTRPITSAIEAAGFKTEWTGSMMLPGSPPIAAWNEWGSAVAA